MHLPLPLTLSSNSHVYVQGDVTIDPSAVISSGVILRANPESKIIIGAGVCIGAGSVIHAYQGTLEVETGASLGAGVLVVGQGKIGANACVGPLTTIWNASIERLQVVPAASVIGDSGRQVADVSLSATPPVSPNPPEAVIPSPPSPPKQQEVKPPVDSQIASSESTTEEKPESANFQEEKSVYGQGSVDRILKTLFPYHQ
ncbi:MAG: carbon dioxide concentrating mechanism protein [Coleofasciculus sp. G1-WW12-02]|uniref:hypothetical protein n=1 Tax=Coleofasciculus sp. G1-WW12-02 TaxID=3068483 RepID=UPI0032F4A138